MNKSRKEDDCQWSAIILEEDSDRVAEKGPRAHDATDISAHKYQQGNDDRKVEVATIAKTLKNLDSLLKVNEGNVKAEDVARESSDPFEPVASVCNR